MTVIEQKRSLVEVEEATPEGAREMAAAHAEVRVAHLIRKAFRLTGETQEELAAKLGVTPGRVSQVLNADGSIRVSTAARYLRAMGYTLEIDANPAEPGTPVLSVRRRRRTEVPAVDAYTHTDGSGASSLLLTQSPQVSEMDSKAFTFVGKVSALSGTFNRGQNQNLAPGNVTVDLMTSLKGQEIEA